MLPPTRESPSPSAADLLSLREENIRLRGDLATIARRLVHDLRTPLGLIHTASEMLGPPPGSDENATRLYRSITASVHEAEELIQRVSMVLMASSRALITEPVRMEEVVWNARQTLDARVRASGAAVVSAAEWPTVTADPALLGLVWENFLLNCLQHAGPRPRIELGWDTHDRQTRFWIRDSGPGVAPRHHGQLFFPLHRLHESNAPRGYGLCLVQRIIELHHGTTGYDLQPAPGGTFFFTLRA
jgi:light-regulated signal transduction histidine kinase (bacteriophytochrome)